MQYRALLSECWALLMECRALLIESWAHLGTQYLQTNTGYGVATINRLLKRISLFCKRAL